LSGNLSLIFFFRYPWFKKELRYNRVSVKDAIGQSPSFQLIIMELVAQEVAQVLPEESAADHGAEVHNLQKMPYIIWR
jgi:hypothetical protein